MKIVSNLNLRIFTILFSCPHIPILPIFLPVLTGRLKRVSTYAIVGRWTLDIELISRLPRTKVDKVDYQELKRRCGDD